MKYKGMHILISLQRINQVISNCTNSKTLRSLRKVLIINSSCNISEILTFTVHLSSSRKYPEIKTEPFLPVHIMKKR